MKTVVGISLGPRDQDFEFTTSFLGEKVHVQRLGAGGSMTRATKLLKHWHKRVMKSGCI